MSIIVKQRGKNGPLRQEILAVATELLLKGGYEGVSMRKIAERLECSPTTIYYYFTDKRAVISNIIESTFKTFNTRLADQLHHSTEPGLQCVRGLMRTYIEFAVENRSHYQVAYLMGFRGAHAENLTNEDRREVTRTLSLIRESLDRAAAEGSIQPLDLEIGSQTLWCGMHGLASLWINCPSHLQLALRDRLSDVTFRMMLIGLGADSEAIDEIFNRSVSP